MKDIRFHCPIRQHETTAEACIHCEKIGTEQECEHLEAAVHQHMLVRLQAYFGDAIGLTGDADGVWCRMGEHLLLSAAYDAFETCVYLETNLTRYGGGHVLVPCGEEIDGCIRALDALLNGKAAFVVHRGLFSTSRYVSGNELRTDWQKLTRGLSVRLIDGQGVCKPKEYAATHRMEE